MNERIKELAKQSLPAFYLTNCPSALEKFAELIVRECADVAYKRSVHSGPSDIFKHFGVEE
jgi:hypothetical protein